MKEVRSLEFVWYSLLPPHQLSALSLDRSTTLSDSYNLTPSAETLSQLLTPQISFTAFPQIQFVIPLPSSSHLPLVDSHNVWQTLESIR